MGFGTKKIIGEHPLVFAPVDVLLSELPYLPTTYSRCKDLHPSKNWLFILRM